MNDLDLAREECFRSPVFFCREVLPHWFASPMPWVHRGVLALLTGQADFLLDFGAEKWADGEGEWTEAGLDKILRHFVWEHNGQRLPLFSVEGGRVAITVSDRKLLIMPRGISKTTLCNAASLHGIAFKSFAFRIYISETATHAVQQLTNVRREVEGNARFSGLFGALAPSRAEGLKWSDDFIETRNGIALAAKGSGAQIRGLNHLGRRPDSILFDDLEDAESVLTDAQKAKTRKWFWGDVVPALPQIGERRGELTGVGSLLANDALLAELMKDPRFITVKFGALDPDGDALWDGYFTKEKLAQEKASFARQGLLPTFYREYLSQVIADETQIFREKDIQIVPTPRSQFVQVAIALDPAISDDSNADFCAFAVVGRTEQGRLHVLAMHVERGMTPRAQVDKFFELWFAWSGTHAGVESIAYQAALVHLIQEEMFRRGKEYGNRAYFELQSITHGKTNKIARIKGILQPRYAAGYITHEAHFPELETQLFEFPAGKKDAPDVLAMAIKLLDPTAALVLDPSVDPLAPSMPPLERELGGNWRYAP